MKNVSLYTHRGCVTKEGFSRYAATLPASASRRKSFKHDPGMVGRSSGFLKEIRKDAATPLPGHAPIGRGYTQTTRGGGIP